LNVEVHTLPTLIHRCCAHAGSRADHDREKPLFPQVFPSLGYRRTDWTGVTSSGFPPLNSYYYGY